MPGGTKMRRAVKSAGIVAVALISLSMSPPVPDERGVGWEIMRLDMDVTPEPSRARLRVEGTAHLRLVAPASWGPALVLNSRRALLRFIEAGAPGATAVLNDTLAGDDAARLARLRFREPLSQGAEIAVTFACESESTGFQLVVRPDLALASWVEGWYPAPLQEEGGAGNAAAPGTTRIVLPNAWSSVSNGRLVESKICDGGLCETWEMEQAFARSFIAGPYESARVRAGHLEVGVHLLSPKPSGAAEHAGILARALTAMEEHFGPYPYPAYAIAEVPEEAVEWSASSEQGFIIAKSSILEVEGGNLPLFAHEAAHGWWGNLVRTTDPGEKFCSESLAEYSAVLAIEKIEGERAATEFLEYSREGYNPLQSALGYFFMWRDGGDKPLAELAQDKWDHNIADSKGAWVLHMLRQEVGEEIFFAVLRGIIEDHAGDEISLATLEAAFTEDAPGKDVPRFFRQWCYRPGAPVIDIEWWSVDKGKGVEIYLRQRQPGEPFRLQCEVAVEMKGGAVASHTIEIDEASEVHRLEISSRPVSVHLDPAHRLLVWRPEYGPMPPGCDVAPAVAQSTGSSEAADVHRAEAELRETEVAFAATMARRDLRAFASFLSEEAVFMGRSTLRGKAAVVEGWRSFFDAPETPFSWFPDEAVVLESGTLGLTSGPVLDPEGTRIGTFNSVWRHDQGRWTLVFDKGCPPCPQ